MAKVDERSADGLSGVISLNRRIALGMAIALAIVFLYQQTFPYVVRVELFDARQACTAGLATAPADETGSSQ